TQVPGPDSRIRLTRWRDRASAFHVSATRQHARARTMPARRRDRDSCEWIAVAMCVVLRAWVSQRRNSTCYESLHEDLRAGPSERWRPASRSDITRRSGPCHHRGAARASRGGGCSEALLAGGVLIDAGLLRWSAPYVGRMRVPAHSGGAG